MKLLNHEIKRKGDNVLVSAQWATQMREPGMVIIVKDKMVTANKETRNKVIEGDVAEVHGILFGLAEIAWNLGWRPRGFVNTVAGIVGSYKIPPPE